MSTLAASPIWSAVCLCLLLLACNAGQEAAEETAASAAETTAADTTEGDAASDGPRTASTDTTRSPLDMRGTLPPTPAPGTAHVRAVVDTCEPPKGDAAMTCRVRIDEVLGYGPATPVLGTGEREVTLPPYVAEQWSAERLSASGPVQIVLRAPGDRRVPDAPTEDTSDAPTDNARADDAATGDAPRAAWQVVRIRTGSN